MTLKEQILNPSGPFQIAWISWVALFFVIEIMALLSDAPRPTLSNHVRDWLRHRDVWTRVLGWAFMTALTFHFMWGLKK